MAVDPTGILLFATQVVIGKPQIVPELEIDAVVLGKDGVVIRRIEKITVTDGNNPSIRDSTERQSSNPREIIYLVNGIVDIFQVDNGARAIGNKDGCNIHVIIIKVGFPGWYSGYALHWLPGRWCR